MKFYNPFKPHIVKVGDYYAVRKLIFLFVWYIWEYRDVKDDVWWSGGKTVVKYSLCKTLDESRDLLKRTKSVGLPKSTYLEN